MEPSLLPQVIQDFIAAANKPDPEAYVDCFSEDALVLYNHSTPIKPNLQ